MYSKTVMTAALVGMAAQVATATSCTSSNATPIEQYISQPGTGGGSGGGGGGGSGAEIFLSHNPFAVFSNAVKRRGVGPDLTPDAHLANIARAVGLQARAASGTVECTATEMCLSVQKAPFCLDIVNGNFHDGEGTTGNGVSGDYTLGDGRRGNLFKGPYPQPSGASAPGAATTGGTNGGGSAPAANTGTGAGASPTPTKNAAVVGRGVGMVGAAVVLGGVLL
ncbi:hypothetical protein QBC35DRAFT_550589 [Podospora australis]|uniref:Uncharacterized protein n=1 Tax=Podospora australis TaxID=1536484 RepID=A0AAN6WX23_9PEZI|nr:hypothetical protein QBC35DRAFT_550589 [Podospora australis]